MSAGSGGVPPDARTPRPRTAPQRAGDAAEEAVASSLISGGWQILGRHVRVGRLELDIVAVDPGPPPALVILEVRWRRSRDFGLPEETVSGQKLNRLRRAAVGLVAVGGLPGGRPLPSLPLRLDVVAVEPGRGGRQVRIRHHRGVGGPD